MDATKKYLDYQGLGYYNNLLRKEFNLHTSGNLINESLFDKASSNSEYKSWTDMGRNFVISGQNIPDWERSADTGRVGSRIDSTMGPCFYRELIYNNSQIYYTMEGSYSLIFKPSTWYTLSWYEKLIKNSSNTGASVIVMMNTIDINVKGKVDLEDYIFTSQHCEIGFKLNTNGWVRHSITFKTKSSLSDTSIEFRLSPGNSSTNNPLEVYRTRVQLEEGKTLSPWKLSQDDVVEKDRKWVSDRTELVTKGNIRIGYVPTNTDGGDEPGSDGNNQGGKKIYFGDSDLVYIGESGTSDTDTLELYGSSGINLNSDHNINLYASDNINLNPSDGVVQINNQPIASAAFRTAGAANGVATLDNSGKVSSSLLPSYVDDVLEYSTLSLFPATGESGKIYVDVSTNTTWRWSGSTYVQIKGDLAIGTTTGTAADGGTVTSHINNVSNPHNVTKSQIGLSNVENKSAATILSELTTSNITTALGYTPLKDADLDRDHTIKSGDFLIGINYGPNNDKYKLTIYQNDINDKLYAANYRFTVTHKVFDSATDELVGQVSTDLFKGDEEAAGNFVAEGQYAELYIGAAPENEIEDATGYYPNMWVYGDDSHMFLTFYYGHLPGTITAKWYEKYTNSWHDATVNKLNDHKYEIVMEGQTTFMAAIKVIYEGEGNESASSDWGKPTSLTDVRLFGRRTTVQEQSNLVKYPIQQLIYGTLIGPKFLTTGGTSSQFLKGDGSLDNNTYVTSSSIQSLANTVGSHINDSTVHVTAAEKAEWSDKQNLLYIEAEVQGGQDASLVSTGEKYTWNHKLDKLTIATSVSSGNSNPVTSGAVYTAINNYTPKFSSGGLVLPVLRLTLVSYTITKNDVIIITANSNDSRQTLTLPSSPTIGLTYMIRIGNSGSVELKSPSGYYLTQNGVMTSTTTSYTWSSGLPVIAIYVGSSRWSIFRAENAT